jgi:hypothetical protein
MLGNEVTGGAQTVTQGLRSAENVIMRLLAATLAALSEAPFRPPQT